MSTDLEALKQAEAERKSKQDYKSHNKVLLKELAETQEARDTIAKVKEYKDKAYNIPVKYKGKNESVACLLGSDWHLGEVVEPDTVNGLNEFNKDIAEKRVIKFFQSGLTCLQIERQATDIRTLILWAGGDLTNGDIHDDAKESNDLTPTQSLVMLKRLIKSGINFLLDEGELDNIVVPCSIGNHGRTGMIKKVATAYKNNYEWLLYHILADEFKDDKRVKFIISSAYHTWVNVFDKYDIRFHHGDYLRYSGGVGGLTVPANKAINEWNKSKRAYLDCFGHFHTYFDGETFVSNGSLVGYNAYAVSIKAPYQQPYQAFFTIDKDRGRPQSRKIFVTEK